MFYLDSTQILPTALLDVYKVKDKSTIKIEQSDENFQCKRVLFYWKKICILCYKASQQTVDEDEQQTLASDVTEQSELNEPIDDLVNSYQINILKI